MKPFEFFYRCAGPFVLPLHGAVRRQLRRIANSYSHAPDILDVGGRKSHYTIGVPARITLTDLPRESEVQKSLHLGINGKMIDQTRSRRSNLYRIIYDDMTQSQLPDAAYECVVAVEVLEHVAEDELFVKNVHRVLKPGGVFLMTTPNGDSVPNHNPDHKRHYRREQLRDLLVKFFDEVEVVYAIKDSVFRSLGLRSWSVKHPIQTLLSMCGNVVNSFQSTSPGLREQATETRHLLAVARKRS